MATLIKASGPPVYIAPANGIGFSLAELQALVGGYIEIVRAPYVVGQETALYLVVNEDGKRLELPPNPVATVLYHQAGGRPDDIVVGDVVLATLAELDEPDEEDES